MIELISTFVKIANYLDMMGCDKHADKFDDMCQMCSHMVDGKHSESYMAPKQLSAVHEQAKYLLENLDGKELEDWQESKIAILSAYMNDVYRSIKHDNKDYLSQRGDV